MKRSKTFLAKAAMLLIVALFSLTGARAQKDLPYEYGFENNDLAAEGWTTLSVGSENLSEFGIRAVAAQTGDYGFGFSSYETDRTSYDQYLISPELNVTSSWGGKVQFSYMASYDGGTERFKVGYSTTDANLSSFIFGSEITTSSASWTSGEFSIPAGTKYVAVYYYSNWKWRLYVDNFVFRNVSPLVISGNPEPKFTTSTHITITCDDVEGATILYSLDEGTSWKTYPAGGFDLTETATVTAKATKEGMEDIPETSKFFLKGDKFTWDLTENPSSYTTASRQQVEWVSTYANMTLAKGSSTTNANNYLGGTGNRNYTRFYNGQTLTIAPNSGFAINSIEITAAANVNNLRDYMTLTNAYMTISGNTVTIIPTDASQPIIATFTNADTGGWFSQERPIQVATVNVNYYTLPTPFIAIASTNQTVKESSASATNKTLNTYYSNVANGNASVVLCDAQGNAASYPWITSYSLDTEKNVKYSIAANTNRETRTAYLQVTSDNVSSPIIAVIQAAAYVLADGAGANNENLILNHRGEKCSVILDSRTFTAGTAGTTGKWYTLCLPFDVTIADSPLAGADARGLDEEGNTRIEGKTLKLEFTDPVKVLEAGTPYIIRWESGDNIVNPAFADVTIKPDMEDWQFDLGEGLSVYFKGSYAYQSFGAPDKTTLFISNNKFYYVGNGTTIGAQRGYFKLDGFSYDPSSTSTGVKEFGITFDEDPTGIVNVNDNLNANETIYNLAGQRISKMQRGINIVNGKKILK